MLFKEFFSSSYCFLAPLHLSGRVKFSQLSPIFSVAQQ
jgi:hypothetical protein